MRSASPLRYPGGKWRFAPFFARLISLNFKQPPTYIEPYAGGASLAISLLLSGKVADIYLNDLDPAIYSFWHSVLKHTDDLVELIERIPVTPQEWMRQKSIYAEGCNAGRLRLGLATFFLNRTNHSGILNGGMIGGKNQSGKWKVDARFNRRELVRRIRTIAAHGNQVHLSNRDAADFVRDHQRNKHKLMYLDPPYYRAGQRLYLNAYRPDDHADVKEIVLRFRCKWVVSYDNVPEIRELYCGQRSRRVNLLHTARTAREGNEIMFFSPELSIPLHLP
jgi:DNA adenine methylase